MATITKDHMDKFLDDLSLIKTETDKISGLESKVNTLNGKVDAIPTTPPEAPEVIIPSDTLKADVKAGMSDYFDDLPSTSGLLSDNNIKRLGGAFMSVHSEEIQRVADERNQKEAKRREERAKNLDIQGVRTVEQVAEWAPEFSPVTQRLMRFFGANIFDEDESAETVHRILKVFGEVLEPVVTPKPPTLKPWLRYKWKQFKKCASKWENVLCCIFFFSLIAGLLSFSLYLHRVIELDRKNRIFYHKVMQDERLKREYNTMDSVVHADPFYEPLRKFR